MANLGNPTQATPSGLTLASATRNEIWLGRCLGNTKYMYCYLNQLVKTAMVKTRLFINQSYHIRITCPCNEHPHTPHIYIEKVGFTRVYIFFLFLLQNIDCGYLLEPPR